VVGTPVAGVGALTRIEFQIKDNQTPAGANENEKAFSSSAFFHSLPGHHWMRGRTGIEQTRTRLSLGICDRLALALAIVGHRKGFERATADFASA